MLQTADRDVVYFTAEIQEIVGNATPETGKSQRMLQISSAT